MKKLYFFVFAGLMVLLLWLGNANALVIDFENVPNANPNTWDNPIPNGYEGLNWDQFDVLHEDYYLRTGYDYGVTSGQWVAYNVWDYTATVSGNLFDFTGAYFTSAWDYNNILTIEGYNNGTLLYSAQLTLNTYTPVWFQADWLGVDSLKFFTSGSQFVMDDLTINESAPIPEPSTIFLVGSGLIGLAGYGRKRLINK